MNHSRKARKIYNKRRSFEDCPFCGRALKEKGLIEFKYSYIVPNLTKYDFWELYDVVDHLLLLPKRHVQHLNELNDSEKLEIISKIAEYEANGYSVYARSQDFNARSEEHQHTHLIKTTNKKMKMALFIDNPYFLFKF